MLSSPIPLQKINDPLIIKHGIDLYILRLDLIHPHISGNKLFKLKYNIEEAKKEKKDTLLTFGGAFSNHIAATAAAGKENRLTTIGIIRGDELKELNPTLSFAIEQGMQLYYVSREIYKNKEALYHYVQDKFKGINYYLIPEGGANDPGIKGCEEITQHINIDFDFICCPCGTGTTIAGIIRSLKNQEQAIGFQVLKAENYIQTEVEKWLSHFEEQAKNNWQINEDFHFGGYAKYNNKLLDFVKSFEATNQIPLDFIYTAKMMYGIYQLIDQGYFKPGTSVIAVHTGGLQGNNGLNVRLSH